MSSTGINLNLGGTTSTTTGLGQGIDVASIVSSIIASDRAPEQIWQSQLTDLSDQATALSSISIDLLDLQTKVRVLTSATGPLNSQSATSSAPAILSASAQASATQGNHIVTVDHLATTSSLYTSAVGSGATLSGAFGLQVGSGPAVPIVIDSANNTLSTLASYINNHNLGVTANVINDANGQRLALISNTTGQPGNLATAAAAGVQSYAGSGNGSVTGLSAGAGVANETITLTATDANTFAVTGSVSGNLGTATVGSAFSSPQVNFTLNAGSTAFQAGDQFTLQTVPANTTGLTFNQVAGQNASLTVDSVPISSATNTVSGVIPGVTLNLLSAAQGVPIQLTVGPDTGAVTDAINGFVSSYNTLVNAINTQFTAPASGGTAPPLEADATLRALQASLLSDVTYAMQESSGNNGLVNLAAVGIDMANDGTLSVDSDTLNNALSGIFAAVQNLFQSTDSTNLGFGAQFGSSLTNLNDPTEGVLNVELQQNAQAQRDLNSQISDFEDRLLITQQQLFTQYSQINATLEQLPLLQNQIASMLGALPK